MSQSLKRLLLQWATKPHVLILLLTYVLSSPARFEWSAEKTNMLLPLYNSTHQIWLNNQNCFNVSTRWIFNIWLMWLQPTKATKRMLRLDKNATKRSESWWQVMFSHLNHKISIVPQVHTTGEMRNTCTRKFVTRPPSSWFLCLVRSTTREQLGFSPSWFPESWQFKAKLRWEIQRWSSSSNLWRDWNKCLCRKLLHVLFIFFLLPLELLQCFLDLVFV